MSGTKVPILLTVRNIVNRVQNGIWLEFLASYVKVFALSLWPSNSKSKTLHHSPTPRTSISPHWFECNPCYMWKVDLLLKPFQCSKLTLGLRICTLANSNSFPDWIEKIKVSAFCLGTAGQNSHSKHGHGKQTKCASKLEAWE